jgi:UDP:flavonoid glycosyltransferase YjiC (YdhE family)
MKRILFTWELGTGLGHIVPIKQRCALLQEHKLYVALRDLRLAAEVFKGTNATLLAAPFLQSPVDRPVEETLCYAELLHNVGFADARLLGGLVNAWRALFDLIGPDVVVFDHSPSALLAARAYSFRKILCGSGFICPPPAKPLGVFFPGIMRQQDLQRIEQAERNTLDTANKVLAASGQPPLSSLGELYGQADTVLLTTWPEFDHFPQRGRSDYLGVNSPPAGKPPQWPAVSGKRIFAYLKPFKKLPVLLQSLKQSGQPVIVYSNDIDRNLLAQHQSGNMCFEFEALDLKQVADSCDFAIVNGNHDTSCQLMLSGTPILVLPLQREQQIFAGLIADCGAGVAGDPDNDDHFIDALNKIASDGRYRQAALEIAGKYSGAQFENTQQSLAGAIGS